MGGDADRDFKKMVPEFFMMNDGEIGRDISQYGLSLAHASHRACSQIDGRGGGQETAKTVTRRWREKEDRRGREEVAKSDV